MTASSRFGERVPTGIPGLDRILEGGLPRGGAYLVEGPPGSGKTILGNQLCFHHASQGGQAIYVTLLAESHARMLNHLRRMDFCDLSLVPEHISYVSTFKTLETEGLTGVVSTILKELMARKATLLVLDGLMTAEEAAGTRRELKRFIHELQSVASMTGCTVVLLSSLGTSWTHRAEHTMVDGIIELTDQLARLRSIRHLRVRKLRGAEQIRGQHTFEITNAGLIVHPRVETQLRRNLESRDVLHGSERLGFGIEQLDAMLYGGLPSNSVTMLIGPSGSGKTILGLQFLAAGASQGEPSLYFGFYERPDALLRKCQRIGIEVQQSYAQGLLRIIRHAPVEGVVDVIGSDLLRAVRELGIRRLCLDGMHEFQQIVDHSERIRDVFSALTEELEAEGVSTVYTMETPALLGPTIQAPVSGLSAVTHNILTLRHVELNARVYRLISVLKLRDGDYDSAIREFRITDHGIRVANSFESAELLLHGAGDSAGHVAGMASSRRKPPRETKHRR